MKNTRLPKRTSSGLRRVQFPGAHRVERHSRHSEAVTIHWYAWRGRGAPHLASYHAATLADAQRAESAGATQLAVRWADVMQPRTSDKHMGGLIDLYRKSAAFTRLAASTKWQWNRWLDKINDVFGETTLAAMSAHGSKRLIIEWRDVYADRPRTADYGVQVLKRLLSWGVESEMLTRNPAAGLGRLYDADLSEEIWEPHHIKAALAVAPIHVQHAIQLAAHTGLRVSDLVELSWDAVHDDEIRWKTRKSNQRTTAVIPITRALRAVLEGIPRRGPTILTHSRGAAWRTPGTLSKAVQAAGIEAGFKRRTHDLRGTAATNLVSAGLSYAEVGLVLGWSEADVQRIAGRYVSRGAVSRGIAERLDRFTAPETQQ